MKNILAWILATLIVTAIVVIIIGGAMLLIHWGHTWIGVIWLIGGALIIRQLGRE